MTDQRKARPKPPQLSLPKWELAKECACCEAVDTTKAIKVDSLMRIHGQEISYTADKYQCAECEHTFQSPEQATKSVKAARVVYQLEHSLLSSAEIIVARNEHNWSQLKLASMAGVGIASVKRWESGKAIQTKDSDKKLRAAFAKAVSSATYKEERYEMKPSTLGWGKVQFAPPKFVQEAFSTPPQRNSTYGITDECLIPG